MDTERTSGFLLPLLLVLWVGGVAYAVSSIDERRGESPGTEADATPVALPTSIMVGRQQDPDTGLASDPALQFESGSSIFFSVWLGRAVGVDTLLASFGRLEVDGFRTGDPMEVSADPDAEYVIGQIAADRLLEVLGPGTYLLKLEFPSGERVGYGEVQVGVEAPQDVEVFVEGWRDATVRAGQHTGFRFDDKGEVIEEKQQALGAEAIYPAMFRATFDGRDYLFMKGGPFENYYLPEPESVALSTAP